jgi:DNA-binding GntR family transcriptional regulator
MDQSVAARVGSGVQPPPAIRLVDRDDNETLTTWVTRQLRLAIQDGQLPLGLPLSELKLAGALGVSRTPVREALSALQQQGLISIRPQSGSYVFTASSESVADLCAFRRIIEMAALRLAHSRRRTPLLSQLADASQAMETALASGDVVAFSRGDTAFHHAIVDNCANEYLVGAYALMSGRVAALRTNNNLRGPAQTRQQALREHVAVIKALTKDDIEAAESILQVHIARMATVYNASTAAGSRRMARAAGAR